MFKSSAIISKFSVSELTTYISLEPETKKTNNQNFVLLLYFNVPQKIKKIVPRLIYIHFSNLSFINMEPEILITFGYTKNNKILVQKGTKC